MALQMEFSGSPEVRAARPAVWRRVIDPHFVAQSAPGMQVVREVGPGEYQVEAAVAVGPFKLELVLDLAISDLVEPEQAKLRAVVNAHGSTVNVASAVRLEELGPGRTRIHWRATTQVDGMLAAMGPELVKGVARKLTSDFWDDFARRVEEAP